MADGNNIGGKAVDQFFSSWSQHPLSVFILTVLITFSFLFMLLHDNASSHAMAITIGSYSFSLLVLGVISYLLVHRKGVLYNSLAVLSIQINERVDHLNEALEKINIEWVQEPYVEYTEWLCPSSAKDPITDEMRQVVRNFELLHHIKEDCGLQTPIEGKVKLKLAKFYYKENNFQRALMYLSEINASSEISDRNKHADRVFAAELHLCKGQIFRKLARPKEAANEFNIAKEVYPFAGCLGCMIKAESNDLNNLNDLLIYTEKCASSSLTEFCINKSSTAYYKKGKASGWQSADGATNIREALNKAQEAIDKFDSCTAYYNRACDLSIMAEFNIPLHENMLFTQNDLKEQILSSLELAFAKRPALVVHSRNDQDLKWIKEKYPHEFYYTVGKVFASAYPKMK